MNFAELKNTKGLNKNLVVLRKNSKDYNETDAIVLMDESFDEEVGGLYSNTGRDIWTKYESVYVKTRKGFRHATVNDLLKDITLYRYYYTGSPFDKDNYVEAERFHDSALIYCSNDIIKSDRVGKVIKVGYRSSMAF